MADKEITIEFEERTITGRYSISQGIVTVISDEGGSKSIQVAGTPHILEGLARIMLRELAQEGKSLHEESGSGVHQGFRLWVRTS